MPIVGQLLSFQQVQKKGGVLKANLILTLSVPHTGFFLPKKIRPKFEGLQNDEQNAYLCKSLELSLKSTSFLKSQVKCPGDQVSPVTFCLTRPESLLWSW